MQSRSIPLVSYKEALDDPIGCVVAMIWHRKRGGFPYIVERNKIQLKECVSFFAQRVGHGVGRM